MDQLGQLQKALDELQSAVSGLSSGDGVRKQAHTPYPMAPGLEPLGEPADSSRVPGTKPRSDEEAVSLTKAISAIASQTDGLNKAVTALIAKQAKEDEEKQDLAKARLVSVRKIRAERFAKVKAAQDNAKMQKMVSQAIAKALGKAVPEDEEVVKAGDQSPYPKAEEMEKMFKAMSAEEKAAFVARMQGSKKSKAIGKQAGNVSQVGLATQVGEGEPLKRDETGLEKAYDEEAAAEDEVAKAEHEGEDVAEEDVEKALVAALKAEPGPEEEDMAKAGEEEIPEELKKLLAAKGFALAGDYNPSVSQVEKARILKSMGYRPVPVTQGLPFSPRSSRSASGATLGDVVDKVKGMPWGQLNSLRTKMGAW